MVTRESILEMISELRPEGRERQSYIDIEKAYLMEKKNSKGKGPGMEYQLKLSSVENKRP